jgi:hypothetical protein
MWHKVAEPSVNLKSSKGGDRGTISGGPSRYSRYAIIVDADYQAREFVIWFQNFINDQGVVDGDKSIRLPWKEADPWAFVAWNHDGTLKIMFKQYQSPDQGNHRRFGVYNTGYYSED